MSDDANPMSSDTAEKIGERLAESLVQQVSDLGGTPEDYRASLTDVGITIADTIKMEIQASKECEA